MGRRRSHPGGRTACGAVRPRRGRSLHRRGRGAGATLSRRAAQGYLLVAGSFVIFGFIGVLVTWTTAPESALLVVRFVTAGAVLGIVFARRRPLAGALRRGVWPRLLLMGLVDSAMLLLFFVAMRDASVAIGMFLLFLAPVWVALLAPRVFRSRTERIVYPALLLALAGLAAILAPSLLGEGVELSAAGVAAGLGAGLGYAAFQLIVKDLTTRVPAVTIVMAEILLDAVILLPLALVQTVGAGYGMTARDLVAGVVLGVLCTAVAYMMWTAGMGRIKVQHSSILGYLEPVSGPIYAFLLLGQAITGWTVLGGALIVGAGVLVVLFGEREERTPSLEPGL